MISVVFMRIKCGERTKLWFPEIVGNESTRTNLIVCFRREISVLQAENYSLERQLFSYQKSLAYAQAQAGEPAAAEAESGRRSPAERSLSTDTEYA